jgi:hypothetical protein
MAKSRNFAEGTVSAALWAPSAPRLPFWLRHVKSPRGPLGCRDVKTASRGTITSLSGAIGARDGAPKGGD